MQSRFNLNLRAHIHSVLSQVGLAEQFKTYEECLKMIQQNNVPQIFSKEDIETGQELLSKSVTSEKLKDAQKILKSALKELE
ncbi:MAG: hypothetical protein QG670_2665 [Thermoproteota archaeon]|nr:hypothetical protein [Thermoproteota archaeon]